VVKRHPDGEGGGCTTFVPSLSQERQTLSGRLQQLPPGGARGGQCGAGGVGAGAGAGAGAGSTAVGGTNAGAEPLLAVTAACSPATSPERVSVATLLCQAREACGAAVLLQTWVRWQLARRAVGALRNAKAAAAAREACAAVLLQTWVRWQLARRAVGALRNAKAAAAAATAGTTAAIASAAGTLHSPMLSCSSTHEIISCFLLSLSRPRSTSHPPQSCVSGAGCHRAQYGGRGANRGGCRYFHSRVRCTGKRQLDLWFCAARSALQR
jgi:hypothetical protein